MLEVVLLWGFAALGVYHLIFRLNLALNRQRHAANSLRDATNQLRFVMAASFYKKKVMSKEEYGVFKAVEEQVAERHHRYRVLAQTSLGEMIGSGHKQAFDSINSKRVDVMILGPFGEPFAAIEYQGGEHYQGNAAARDAVKREALRKAGVAYIEIDEKHTPDDIKRFVRDELQRADPQGSRAGSPR